MTLLEFARGPGMEGAVLIMVAGVCWRLAGIFFLPWRANLSEHRNSSAAQIWAGIRVVFTRMWPKPAFRARVLGPTMLSYAMHLGLVLILIGGGPHILLWKAVFGFGWPGLPKYIVGLGSSLTLILLAVLFARRLHNPVLRLLSTFDDYLALVLTALPVLTGLMLARAFPDYELMLALHILSVELLMICLPFCKLSHVFLLFVSRMNLGIRFSRKGATL